ncbi:hypothetical protein LF817_02665 [Halobacillus sp. A1]|uniref:hypothetical protein n=1 Tax=Halobacillus sp. A1 TaxID=2880262 RepID=UPI0020A682E8|nr:hypothetical protein [Halobacillus sp. A1]MCP3030239.1 hypothetical protein [Halobacillus sp. A1]
MVVQHIVNFQSKIDEIKPIHIINYLDSLGHDVVRKDGKAGGLASTSVLYHYRVLEDIFSRAQEWILIKENPVRSVKRPKIDNT